MAALGVLMPLVFGHIRFVLHKRLRSAVQGADRTHGAEQLAAIRRWVSANLALGVLVILVALLRLPA